MIIWSGKGFLPIVLLFGIFFLGLTIFPDQNHDYGFVLACFIAGIFSWFFGRKWNAEKVKEVINPKTGEKLLVLNSNTLFWIPMQYWGFLFGVFGIGLLFKHSTLYGVICSIILLGLTFWAFMVKRSEPKPAQFKIKKKIIISNDKSLEAEKQKNQEEDQKIALERERIRKEKEDPRRFMPQ